MSARLLSAVAAAFLAWNPTSTAWAQGQVYDPVPPRGSAYVRLVNVLPGEVTARPDSRAWHCRRPTVREPG